MTWRRGVGIALVLAAAALILYVQQRLEEKRGGEQLQALVKSMAGRYAKADRDFAERMKATRLETAIAVIGSERIADAAARSAASATVAAALAVADDFLAGRGRIAEEAVAQIQAAGASAKVTEAAVAGIRAAAAGSEPLSVRMAKATRAFLARAGELLAFVDANAAGLALRDGQLDFADQAAAEHFNALEAGLDRLARDLQQLQQELRKPR